jgi:hypothetical protein
MYKKQKLVVVSNRATTGHDSKLPISVMRGVCVNVTFVAVLRPLSGYGSCQLQSKSESRRKDVPVLTTPLKSSRGLSTGL